MDGTGTGVVEKFAAASVGAGCEISRLGRAEVKDLDLAVGAVASSGALEHYPELRGRMAIPAESPLTSFPQGVIHGELAIAETGSVLVVENDLPDRLVSMMAENLVVLVAVESVRESLDAAVEWFSAANVPPAYAVLLTGPSRTADIERSLTIGVQGPTTTRIVLVAEDS